MKTIVLWLRWNVLNKHIVERERSTTVVVLISGAFVWNRLIYERCLHLSDKFAYRSAHNNLFLTLRVIHKLKKDITLIRLFYFLIKFWALSLRSSAIPQVLWPRLFSKQRVSKQVFDNIRMQGWRCDESTRVPTMSPGFLAKGDELCGVDEFSVGFWSCWRFVSVYSDFPLSSKTNMSKFQFQVFGR